MEGYLYNLSYNDPLRFEYKEQNFIEAHGTNTKEVLDILVNKFKFEIDKRQEYNANLQGVLFLLENAQKNLNREFAENDYIF